MYAPLIELANEEEYRQYYKEKYCREGVFTHDGLLVRFRPDQFGHAFFVSQDRRISDKSIFSKDRALRIGWIKKALADPSLIMYAGWDSKKKRYDHTRRVCLVTPDSYVIVLRLASDKVAIFVTAYIIDDPVVEDKIKSGPLWNKVDKNGQKYA
ncbi:hypothetical protein JCM14036_12550 [Desulfotomaculum defluvii]